MNRGVGVFAVGFYLGAIAMMVFLARFGAVGASRKLEQEAIECGFATWSVDQSTLDVTFNWKEGDQ